MITKYKTKELLLNTSLAGHQAGTKIPIKVDHKGTPIDRYWRDRIKDSKIDGCVEFASKKKK